MTGLALVVAVLCIPTVAGITAWGLAGGDGTPETPLHAVLAVLVGGGALYNAVTCYLALFDDVAAWRWWLMWAAPAAGVLGILLAGLTEESQEDSTALDFAVGFGMQALVAVPVVLLGLSGAVAG